MPILVTGARGNVGQWVVRELISVGLPVRAAVRHPGRTEPDPATSGVDWVRFDFTDPSTWAAAFAGSRVMFLVRPPQISQVKRDLLPAVRAAYAAGVRHVVFLSLQGADRSLVVPHAQVERSLRNSPLGWTFIRASFFMQNLSTTHAADIRDRSQIVVRAGHGRTAFVDAADVASVAAAALRDPQRHAGRAWIPTGPDAIGYDRVAEIMSEVLEPAGLLPAAGDAVLRQARPPGVGYAVGHGGGHRCDLHRCQVRVGCRPDRRCPAGHRSGTE